MFYLISSVKSDLYFLYFWKRVNYSEQLEAKKQCLITSEWLNFGTPPYEYRSLLHVVLLSNLYNYD